MLCITFPVFGQGSVLQRVQAHWALGDYPSATAEVKEALCLDPDDAKLQRMLLMSLCKEGRIEDALRIWQGLEDQTDQALIEELAWGVLVAAESSQQLPVRLYALLGVCSTRDAKAIAVLLKHLRGSNAWLRALAARFSARFGDAPLREELLRLARQEKNWFVRLEVMRSLGALHVKAATPILERIVADPKSSMEEKQVAIESLVHIYADMDDSAFTLFAKSPRAGLRQLACHMIAYLDRVDKVCILIDLCQDRSAEVRLAALCSLGMLRVYIDVEHIAEKDPAFEVAVGAAWLGMLFNEPWASAYFTKWIMGDRTDLRRLASAALAASGRNGIELSGQLLSGMQDPYVSVNLALGLIGHREQLDLACNALFKALQEKTLWMWDASLCSLFRSLAPTKLRHIEGVAQYPQAVDQWVRLDILSVLSMLRHPRAEEAVYSFLQSHAWATSGMAAGILLEEGGEGALESVQKLLEDADQKVRVQAALILSFLGGEPAAISVLQNAYPHLDKEMQVHILEALGHIGDKQALPFLLSILQGSSQNMRVVAASAIIQCIYH